MSKISLPKLAVKLLQYARTYDKPLTYPEGYSIISSFLQDWFDYKITGRENIPESPFIICANHASFLDMLMLAAAVYPHRVSYLAKPEFFMYDKILQRLAKTAHLENAFGATLQKAGKIVTDHAKEWGAIRIKQRGLKKTVFKYYVDQAKTKNIGIFPEGHRSTPSRKYKSKTSRMMARLTEEKTTETDLQKFQGLAAKLMIDSGNSILPIGIRGNYNITPWFLLTKRQIEVNIGEPMDAREYTDRKAALQELEHRIKKLIL
jgi:1-acyl-sn-glycerol-3-phosphate acyltransferase